MMRWLGMVGLLFVVGCMPSSSARPPLVEEAPTPGAAERAKPARPGSDWPGFLGPAQDGSSPETGIRTAWPKDGLPKLWSCPLGIGYAPPSIADGKLYHFDRFEDNARLTCRNAETGEFLWKFEYPTDYVDQYGYDPGPRACPVIEGDRVYIYGVEGMLHCVSTVDGKLRWKVDTKAKYRFRQNFFGVGSVPVIEGNLLIVAVGGNAGTSAIVAFDKLTGDEKYAFGDELASYSSPRVVTIGGKRVGLYFARGGLLGFDPVAGSKLFHYPWRARTIESVNAANPIVSGDNVLITECYEKGSALLKVAPTGVSEVWTDAKKDRDEKAMMAHWCTPMLEGGFVYGCSARHRNEADLRCVDLATGEVKWVERNTTRVTLTKIDGHLLSFGEGGELRLIKINPTKYEELARWDVPGLAYPSWAMPVVSRGRLYLRGKDDTTPETHRLICLNLMK